MHSDLQRHRGNLDTALIKRLSLPQAYETRVFFQRLFIKG